MDGNGFKVSRRIRNMGLFGSAFALALLFLSSSFASGLEVTTEDGRDAYEQGEIIIFRISGMNNSTVYINFVHIVTTRIGNNTTYQKDWYGLNPITLNETGKGTVFHSLDYQTVFGNQEATYGDWDFEVFESVNETTIEFLSYRFKVEVNWDLVLREWDDKHEEDEREQEALLAGLDARDNFKNWVIVGLAFLFMMNIATHHLGENPVLIFLRNLAMVIGRLFRTAEQGEVDAVTASDGATLSEWKWRERENTEKLERDAVKGRNKAKRKMKRIDKGADKRIDRIDQSRKARKELLEQRVKEYDDRVGMNRAKADSIDVPTRDLVEVTIKGGKNGSE